MDRSEPSSIYIKESENKRNPYASGENIFEEPLSKRRQKINKMKPLHLDFSRLRRRKTINNIHELVNLEYISDEEDIDPEMKFTIETVDI